MLYDHEHYGEIWDIYSYSGQRHVKIIIIEPVVRRISHLSPPISFSSARFSVLFL